MNFEQADALNEAIRAVGSRHRALSVAALEPFGIHPGHKLILFELDAEGSRTQAQLAAATGFEPPTITLSVRQLESAGLVVRRPSPTDRRATLVELSDKGRALLPDLKAAWCRVAEQAVAGFTAVPLGQLTDVLADLAASLDSSGDQAASGPSNEPVPALPRDIARRIRKGPDPVQGSLPSPTGTAGARHRLVKELERPGEVPLGDALHELPIREVAVQQP